MRSLWKTKSCSDKLEMCRLSGEICRYHQWARYLSILRDKAMNMIVYTLTSAEGRAKRWSGVIVLAADNRDSSFDDFNGDEMRRGQG